MFKNQQKNFILQQGFSEPSSNTCPVQYKALLFQPWIVLIALVGGILFQSPIVFGILAAVLYFSALFPKGNPFDAAHNAIWGRRPGAIPLSAAPTPRRFSQAMAGTFALAIALLLNAGQLRSAHILEGLFLLAVVLLVSGGFCMGSVVFHSLMKRSQFVKKTLPWA